MLINKFPINRVPSGRQQTNNYIKALDIKSEAEQVAKAVVQYDGSSSDLNPTDQHVALSRKQVKTGANLGYATITGAASYEGSKEAPESIVLQADLDMQHGDRTLTARKDGDKMRYTRQFMHQEVVEHMVHDTATDTFNYFLRDDQGRFLPKD